MARRRGIRPKEDDADEVRGRRGRALLKSRDIWCGPLPVLRVCFALLDERKEKRSKLHQKLSRHPSFVVLGNGSNGAQRAREVARGAVPAFGNSNLRRACRALHWSVP